MKYHGFLGIASTTEIRPGVYKKTVDEVEATGDVETYSRRTSSVSSANGETSLNVRLSVILPDRWSASEIKYATWRGAKWAVTSITPGYPRLFLELGGPYNG